MNCFLHGIEDFRIERGDTLAEPKLVQGDRLMCFDVALANPPYSIKQWDRDAFSSDPWGRNLYGTPPQSRADYAFWQHILQSLAPKTGRCAILFPHGVLFRQEEADMRRKLIAADVIECVLGLEPNLFYNSSMEACVVICRTAKAKERRNKILFINAINEVTRERTQSFLTDDHIEHIVSAYQSFKDATSFAKVASLEEIRANDHSLKIDLYVPTPAVPDSAKSETNGDLSAALGAWMESRVQVRDALSSVLTDAELPRIIEAKPNLQAVAELLSRFDRSQWTRVRFGNVVRSVKDTIDPTSGELNRYIAGEHLDSADVHIRRWGTVGDGYLGPAFIRRFRKGQVLYGSRRTYLKKVAMADFDGITANTTFVLETVKGKLLQELLPWLMLSERFTQHSIRESKGSTNPYINFPDIAKFEFALPPLDQQPRIAEILWAVDEVSERFQETEAASEIATVSSRRHHFESALKECAASSVTEIGHWSSGKTPSRDRRELWSGDFPWVSPKDMKTDLIADAEEHISEEGRKASIEVGAGALLIVIRGMILAHSFPVGITQRPVAFNQDMKAITPCDTYSVDYLFNWFKWSTPVILARISDSSHGTKRLSMDDLFSMKVPKLPLAEQRKVVDQINELEAVKSAANRNVKTLAAMRTAFLNSIVTDWP